MTKKKSRTAPGRSPDGIMLSFDGEYLGLQIHGDLSDLPSVGKLLRDGLIVLDAKQDDANLGRVNIYTLTELGHDRVAYLSRQTNESGPGSDQEFRPTPLSEREGGPGSEVGDAGAPNGGDDPAGAEIGDSGYEGSDFRGDAGSPTDVRESDGNGAARAPDELERTVDAVEADSERQGDEGTEPGNPGPRRGNGAVAGGTEEIEAAPNQQAEGADASEVPHKVHSKSGVVYPDPFTASLSPDDVRTMHANAAKASENQIRKRGGRRAIFLNHVASGLLRDAADHFFSDLGYDPAEWQVNLTGGGMVRGEAGEYLGTVVCIEKIFVPIPALTPVV